jgi:hypothetical protein
VEAVEAEQDAEGEDANLNEGRDEEEEAGESDEYGRRAAGGKEA